MRDVRLREIMVTKVISLQIRDSLVSAEEKFRVHGIRHLPVLDEKQRVIGILTQRDLSRCMAARKTEEGYVYDSGQLNHFILKYIMTLNPVTLGPEDTIGHVVEIMARDKFGCIPIVDAEHVLLGIVTQIDVLKYIARFLKGETQIKEPLKNN